MERLDITYVDVIQAIALDKFDKEGLVTILSVLGSKLKINTISEMARKEGKSPNGIRTSKRYEKIKIGKQIMAVKL